MIQEFDRQHFRFNAWLHHGSMNDIPWKKCFLVSAVVLTMPFQGCKSLPKEVKYQNAEPGDALVVSEGTTIELSHAFKAGEPNGLYDGGVIVDEPDNGRRLIEINAVCSMPDLPNWPEYDNIYGRWLEADEEPGVDGGDTDWQLLMYFDGRLVNQGKQEAPSWAKRLAENLCRKGDFEDESAKNQ
jgi:hypothetical protein